MSSRLEEAIETMEEGTAPRFVLVCVMLLLLVGLLMILPENTIGHSVMSIFTGMVLVAAVWAAHLRSRLVHVVNAVVAVAVLGTIVALILHDDTSPLAFVVVMTLFTIAMPTTIIIALRDERTVNIQSVFGAISLYFMLGLLFAFLITAAEKFMDQPYFAQGTDGSLSQRVYFSFITLATVGYGDLTPATGLGRMMSVFESVLGSLYLVTAVSLVVARLGKSPTGAER